MAIVIEGSSKCKICGNVIEDHNDSYSIPAINVINELDPLYQFSDSVVHKACLVNEPLGEEIILLVELWLDRTEPSKINCVVCKNKIVNPDDYYLTGFFTNNKNHPLYKFNFLHFHKSHIEDWEGKSELLGWLKLYKEKDGWQGSLLDELVEIMSVNPDKLNDRWKVPSVN